MAKKKAKSSTGIKFEKWTRKQLLDYAKGLKLTNLSGLKKGDLIEKIKEASEVEEAVVPVVPQKEPIKVKEVKIPISSQKEKEYIVKIYLRKRDSIKDLPTNRKQLLQYGDQARTISVQAVDPIKALDLAFEKTQKVGKVRSTQSGDILEIAGEYYLYGSSGSWRKLDIIP